MYPIDGHHDVPECIQKNICLKKSIFQGAWKIICNNKFWKHLLREPSTGRIAFENIDGSKLLLPSLFPSMFSEEITDTIHENKITEIE